ncbi:hypothetical protein [Chitinimonas lacunae]|uniref:DUF3298 domain-containing protein n=1 Tax=Chitinimonas lacunae TaxID=1963018 RepID=A0ABV8MRX6_9NEIS
MKRHLSHFLALSLALSTTALAETIELMGRVDRAAVVMELSVADDQMVSGRYFYRKYRRDISLSGQRDRQGTISLCEGFDYAQGCKGLTLRPDGKGRWQGQWHDGKAKRLSVELEPLRIEARAEQTAVWPRAEQGSRYGWARLEGLTFQQGRTETQQGRRLQWWSEPLSGIAVFRLVDGYPAPALARLNRALETRHWQLVADALECTTSQGAAGLEAKATPKLLGETAVSIDIFTTYDCGGAHPDFTSQPLNLEVASGRTLELGDLLWLGQGKPLPQNLNGEMTEQWMKYSTAVQGPWIAKTMAQHYPKRMKEGDCYYNDPELWNFPSWYLTPKGLYLGPSFPRALRSCEYPDWSVLPWSVVDRHRGAFKAKLP